MTNRREWTWTAQVCARWAIATSLALGFGATGWLAAQDPPQNPVGAHRASHPSAARASYLIQGTSIYSPQALAKAQGWTVTHRLELINAIAVDAPMAQVEAIAPSWPGVTRVMPHDPLTTTGKPDHRAGIGGPENPSVAWTMRRRSAMPMSRPTVS